MAENEDTTQEVEDVEIDIHTDDDDVNEDTHEEKSVSTGRDWEQEARGMGWNPDYDGDDAIDAREYVLREPIFKNMKKLKRKARDLEAALKSQQDVMNKIIEKQRKEEMDVISKKRKEAIEEGNLDEAFSYDAQLKEISSKPATPKPSMVDPFYESWLDKNQWYEEDEDARIFADAFADRLVRESNGQMPQSELFDKTTQRVKARFPELFQNKRRSLPAEVDVPVTRGNPGKSTRGGSYKNKIPKDFRRVAESQIAGGAFGEVTKEEGYKAYYEGLLAAGIVDADD